MRFPILGLDLYVRDDIVEVDAYDIMQDFNILYEPSLTTIWELTFIDSSTVNIRW